MGVTVLAAIADSDGNVELVDNPRYLQRRLELLERAQQALAETTKTGRRDGGGRRGKARERVRRLHADVANARKDHAHQLSARLAASFDTITFEQLTITNMTRSAKGTVDEPGANVAAKSGLNRSILDAGWGQLIRYTTYKAESAGRAVQRIPAPHTSQTCAHCGHTDPDSRITRDAFCCTACGHTDHADANAARVVLAVAQGTLTIERPTRRRTPRPGSGHRDAA